jgi:hypothetical protein
MASYVERIIDFLEKLLENDAYPKIMLEDIEWAIEVISANKLKAGNMNIFKLDELRPEIRAWLQLISMDHIPLNIEEQKRLREFEELHKLEN